MRNSKIGNKNALKVALCMIPFYEITHDEENYSKTM